MKTLREENRKEGEDGKDGTPSSGCHRQRKGGPTLYSSSGPLALSPAYPLTRLPAVFIQLIESHQHVPGLAAIGRAEDTGVVQLVDDARGPSVADSEAPLKQRG